MTKCDHSAWLEFWQSEAGPLLSHGWRLPQITKNLPNPSEQYPQIAFFLGRHVKEKALRTLCNSNYKGPRRKHAVNIRADNRTLHALHPRLFADCDPTFQIPQPVPAGARSCHQDHISSIGDLPPDCSMHDVVMGRLLFMFADVICIFADDFGGLNAVHEMLSKWVRIGSASSLPSGIRPRVIVVVSNTAQSVTSDVIDETDFFFELNCTYPDLLEVFSDIRFCYLPSDELSSEARFLSLSTDISRQLYDTRFIRLKNQVMFSATHLTDIFKLATHKICVSPTEQFDFIAATREQNPLDGAFGSYLIDFLTLSGKATLPYDGIASHIASAILMDAYPPGMHCLLPIEYIPAFPLISNSISPSYHVSTSILRDLLSSTSKGV